MVIGRFRQPNARYDLATDTGATTYAGLDPFDRTKTCLWQDYNGPPCERFCQHAERTGCGSGRTVL